MKTEETFLEVFQTVVYKLRNGELMMTAKEEFVEDVIVDAIECFGQDFVFGVNNNE